MQPTHILDNKQFWLAFRRSSV